MLTHFNAKEANRVVRDILHPYIGGGINRKIAHTFVYIMIKYILITHAKQKIYQTP